MDTTNTMNNLVSAKAYTAEVYTAQITNWLIRRFSKRIDKIKRTLRQQKI